MLMDIKEWRGWALAPMNVRLSEVDARRAEARRWLDEHKAWRKIATGYGPPPLRGVYFNDVWKYIIALYMSERRPHRYGWALG